MDIIKGVIDKVASRKLSVPIVAAVYIIGQGGGRFDSDPDS